MLLDGASGCEFNFINKEENQRIVSWISLEWSCPLNHSV
jgi:hypothetical protein